MTRTPPARRLAVAAAFAAALAAAGCAAVAEARKAPPVRGETWLQAKGDPNTLTEGRWALLVVFRPEAPACAEGMAGVAALQERYGPRGLAVLGVTAADAETTEPFLKENSVTFPVLVDGQHVIDSYGIPEVARNHTYLTDPPGIVIVQSDMEKTQEVLERYLTRIAKR